MTISNEILDELLKKYEKPEDMLGKTGLLQELTKRLVERAMETEMTEHLGYEKSERSEKKPKKNARNGHSEKTIQSSHGATRIEVPRDRAGAFEPKIIPKGQRRWDGLDDKIVSMYARGMTTRDIQGHLEEMYGVAVSPTRVSKVTSAVTEDVQAWQARPLSGVYPIVYLDALVVQC